MLRLTAFIHFVRLNESIKSYIMVRKRMKNVFISYNNCYAILLY